MNEDEIKIMRQRIAALEGLTTNETIANLVNEQLKHAYDLLTKEDIMASIRRVDSDMRDRCANQNIKIKDADILLGKHIQKVNKMSKTIEEIKKVMWKLFVRGEE